MSEEPNETQPKRRPGRPPKPKPSDEWKADAISLGEQLRLSEIQRPFPIHVQGRFVLAPDKDPAELIAAALNGRENTTANLLLLHRHMRDSFRAGGVALASGPLYAELQRILRSEGLIPEAPPPQTLQDMLRGRI